MPTTLQPSPSTPATRRFRAVTRLVLALGLVVRISAQPATARVEPAAQESALGTTVSFCIETTGPGPFSYQWKKNGVLLPGQTNQCLTVTNLALHDGGTYRATVANPGGALESEEGTLLIPLNTVPGADLFGNGTPIAAVTNSVRGASFAATREPGEPPHLGLSTSNSVWYTWRAPASGIVTFDTRGSTFDTLLAVYTGDDFSRLTLVASDDDSGGFHTSRLRWNAQAGVAYHVVIDGLTGETGTYLCNWDLEITGARVPVFTLQPRSVSALAGGPVTFRTAATDPRLELSFQWFRNGQLLPGATSSNLTIANVQPAHLGRYQVAVTNSVGRVSFSAAADLEIGPVPDVVSVDKIAETPVGGGSGGGAADGFAPASVSAGTFSLAAGTIIQQRFFSSGTTDRCEPAHCGVAGGASRWFQLAATADGLCTIDTAGSDVNTVLAVYLQNFSICTNLYEPWVDCNNDAFGSCEQVLGPDRLRVRTSRLSFFATAGAVYRVVVDSAGGVRGTNLQFNVRFDPPAAAHAKVVEVGTTTNCLLQIRGSSIQFQVPTNLAPAGTTYQWQVGGRRIAGATRDRLVLPFLDYSDAGRYSVTLQTGATRQNLPGATVVVLTPCHLGADAGTNLTPLVGVTPESLILETTPRLDSASVTSVWKLVGTIAPTNEPIVWDAGQGPDGFYRARRPSP